MKALVAYYSQTGNTEKLARKIYDALEADKKIEPISENPQADEYDIVFVGFPVMVHSAPVPVQNFIKSLPQGKKIAIFSTHGSLRGGPLAVTAMEHAVSLAAGHKVLGQFGCRGKVKLDLIEALLKQPENRAWAEEAQSASSHPDEADLEDCAEFVKEIMAKARKL